LPAAEVTAIPLTAATFFAGNIDETRRFLREYGYNTPETISESHLDRRLHAIEPALRRAPFEPLPKPSSGVTTPIGYRRWTL
jgi:hypothetical protein